MMMLICTSNTKATFEAQFMEKLNNTECWLNKRGAYKKVCIFHAFQFRTYGCQSFAQFDYKNSPGSLESGKVIHISGSRYGLKLKCPLMMPTDKQI